MIEVILILETETDKIYNFFNSSDHLEEYLKTINLNSYCYTNILFKIDDEIDFKITKMYKERYLNQSY